MKKLYTVVLIISVIVVMLVNNDIYAEDNITHKVTFVSNEGYIDGDKDETIIEDYVVDGSYVNYLPDHGLPLAYNRPGYVFEGWITNLDSGVYKSYDKPITSDVTFTAKWREGVRVRFHVEDGYFSNPIQHSEIEYEIGLNDSLRYETPVIGNQVQYSSPESTTPGLMFDYWKSDSDDKTYSTEELLEKQFQEDESFHVVWKEEVYIEFYSKEGKLGRGKYNEYNEKSLFFTLEKGSVWSWNSGPYNGCFTSPDDEAVDYWTLDGTSNVYTLSEIKQLQINNNMKFIAHWTNVPIITFDFNDGYIYTSGPGGIKKDYNQRIIKYYYENDYLSDYYSPEKDGYDFLGWMRKGDNKVFYPGVKCIVKEDATFVALWKYNCSKNGHKEVIDEAVPSTTISTGLTEGSHCSECGSIIRPQTVTPRITGKDEKKEDKSSKDRASGDNGKKYSNEWIDGKWYNADGSQTYKGTLQWKSDSIGYWVEDTDGWYPTDAWQKIDGVWYYFKPDGYMASNEYYKGYWFNSNGSWDDKYLLSWKANSTGWWVEDISGWWPSNSWLKIDGYWYYFDASGYMVTIQYVDGYWIGADGVCR